MYINSTKYPSTQNGLFYLGGHGRNQGMPPKLYIIIVMRLRNLSIPVSLGVMMFCTAM